MASLQLRPVSHSSPCPSRMLGALLSVRQLKTVLKVKFPSRLPHIQSPLHPATGKDRSWRAISNSFDQKFVDEDFLRETNIRQSSDIIFLGTGTSEGVPRVSCLTNLNHHCPVCISAAKAGNKNRRRNTSLIVRHQTSDGRWMNILIDAGKFFYNSALQWFPYYGIRQLDAVIITHSHADAIGGLDDLRDWTNNIQDDIPIYVTQRDLEVISKTHYYIVDTSMVMKGTAVSTLKFNIIDKEPFHIEDLQITPLPVWHGPGYLSFGYRIGNVCYISDVSEIPEETYPLLENCDLLILDALRPERPSATHFALPQALEEVRKICPKRTLFTGMMHLMDHDKINDQLATLQSKEGLDVQLSYDGLRIPVHLKV